VASTQRLRLHLFLTDDQGETDTTSAYTDGDTYACSYSGDAAKRHGSERDRINTSEEEVNHMREGCPEEEGTRK
jgi:hypothetical protein